MVSLPLEESLRFRLRRIEYGDWRTGLAVERNIQIPDHHIGILQIPQNPVQRTGLIRSHIDSDDQIIPALIPRFLQRLYRLLRLIHDETDNAELRAVRSQHRINIDIMLRQNRSHPAESALCIRCEKRYLM